MRLRDDAIFPFINRSDYAPTIYPPVAQMVFSLSPSVPDGAGDEGCDGRCRGGRASLRCCCCSAWPGMPRARVLIYAWNPVVVWEFGGNGHVDALSIALIGLAMLAALSRRQGWPASRSPRPC